VRFLARHKLLVFRQWLLEAYDVRLDLETVDLDLLTEEEMAHTHRVMVSKVENKRLAPGTQSDLKPLYVQWIISQMAQLEHRVTLLFGNAHKY
jgi:hypothetical protein